MPIECIEARENGVCVVRCLEFFKKLNLRVCAFVTYPLFNTGILKYWDGLLLFYIVASHRL